jgi:transposase
MGVKNPRRYSPEFIEQALRLAKDLGSGQAAAEKLGIPVATVHGWRKRQKLGSLKSVSRVSDGGTPVETSEEEVRRLRKEVEELKKANYILKRAAAFFSQDHLK